MKMLQRNYNFIVVVYKHRKYQSGFYQYLQSLVITGNSYVL